MQATEVVLEESTPHTITELIHSMALTNIQKVVASVLRRYHIEAVDEKEELKTHSVGVAEKEGPLSCRIRFREGTKQ